METNLFNLVSALNFSGVSFCNVKAYSSDTSEQSEIADFLMNLGVSSKDATIKDKNDLSACENVGQFANERFNAELLEICKDEILNPKPSNRKGGNLIFFNEKKTIAYCENTGSLLLIGFKVRKTVIRKGEFKERKSSEKTLCKEYLKKCLNFRMLNYKTLKISNILGGIRVNGDTLEVGYGF